jgi:hypothetical protein
MVTAEAAMTIPALVAVVALLLCGAAAGMTQLRCGDAARGAARAVARGEPPDVVRALALEVAPDGAEVRVRREGGLYRVLVTAPAPGPWTMRLTAEGVAHVEPGP